MARESPSVRRAQSTLVALAVALALARCDAVTESLLGQDSCEDSSDTWKYRCARGDVVEHCAYNVALDSYSWTPEWWCREWKDGLYHCEEHAGDRCVVPDGEACCVRDAPPPPPG